MSKKEFSPESLLELLKLAGEYGPMVLELFQKIVDALRKKPVIRGAAGGCDHNCDHCDEDSYCCVPAECIDALIAKQLEALAEAVHIKHCDHCHNHEHDEEV